MSIQGNFVGGIFPTAEQVGARPNTWMPTAEEVGARPNTWTPTATEVGAIPVINYNNTGCYYRETYGVVEWINPPFDINEEYRTIERYAGLPVYTKAVELDLAPQGSKYVWIASGISSIVSIDGSVYYRPDSTYFDIGKYSGNTAINMYGNFIWNVTENSFARMVVKYTK